MEHITSEMIIGILSKFISPSVKIDNADVNLIRNDRAQFGLINCDNFSLKLILQEGDAAKKINLPPVSTSEAHESTASSVQTSNDAMQHIKNIKIGSFFFFDSADVSDKNSLDIGSCKINFLTNEKIEVVSDHLDHKGNWRLSVVYTPGSDIRIKTDMVIKELRPENMDVDMISLLNSVLPCAKSSPKLYRNGDQYCALARLKHEAIINLDANAVRFSKAAFRAVYAAPIFRKRRSRFFLEPKMNIFAMVGD